MRLTIVNPVISGRMEAERKRSTSILARKPGNLNRRMREAALRRVRHIKSALPKKQGPHPDPPPQAVEGWGGRHLGPSGPASHRHFAMPHRCAGGEAFGRIEDRVGVEAVVPIEIVDGAGLAEMLDPERLDAMAAHAAEPAQRRRMAVDHGDDTAIAR